MKKLLFMLFLIPLLGIAQNPQDYTVRETTFTMSATGTTSAFSVLTRTGASHRHTVSIDETGSDSCTINLEGSIDNSTWYSLSGDQDCSADLMFHVVNRPVSYIRMNLGTLDAGSLVIKYIGEAN